MRLLALLLAVASAAEQEEEGEGDPYVFPEQPRFFDYDCTVVQEPRVVDWTELHRELWLAVQAGHKAAFDWRPAADPLLADADAAEAECPLGYLFFAVVRLYHTLHHDLSPQRERRLTGWSDTVKRLLRRFRVFEVAASRWPIYEALDRWVTDHPKSDEFECPNRDTDILQWENLRNFALKWTHMKKSVAADDASDTELDTRLGEVVLETFRKPDLQRRAQGECALGVLFLCVLEVIACF